MDRCRCEDYAEAVRKLRVYTVGSYRPDIIENYDRSGFIVKWATKVSDYFDMKFTYPKAIKIYIPNERPDNNLTAEARKIEQMWCPYMTPVIRKNKNI